LFSTADIHVGGGDKALNVDKIAKNQAKSFHSEVGAEKSWRNYQQRFDD
jgi:hypothetical protein